MHRGSTNFKANSTLVNRRLGFSLLTVALTWQEGKERSSAYQHSAALRSDVRCLVVLHVDEANRSDSKGLEVETPHVDGVLVQF